MPKKKTHSKSTAKDVFYYLLMIIMLYAGVISFIALLWQYVNVQFPDPLTFYFDSASNVIRNSIATLLVVWPVFILMSWLIGRDVRKEKEKAEIWVRKWLLYLTLFVAAITIIVDLVQLTNSFLGGELTGSFALKLAVVLIVAAAVFGYYFWELRRDPSKLSGIPRASAIATSSIGLIAIIAGFFIVGTPAEQRERRFDEQRVYHLQSIQSNIVSFWQAKDRLPATLSELNDPLSGYMVEVDPATGDMYEYRVMGDLSFELCAMFTTESDTTPAGVTVTRFEPALYGGIGTNETWAHDAGRTCFQRTIDPELYADDNTPKPAI